MQPKVLLLFNSENEHKELYISVWKSHTLFIYRQFNNIESNAVYCKQVNVKPIICH